MKILVFLFAVCSLSFTTPWLTDFDTAQSKAKEKHQLIMLNFSGSDWCGPCIRMRKEIFNSEVFSQMADSSLQLVNADFPRKKKNALPKKIKKQNEELADKYNPEGKFPFTVLLDAKGKVIKSWDGLPDENATAFTKHVKELLDARK
jgi:thioredoxin-related protein